MFTYSGAAPTLQGFIAHLGLGEALKALLLIPSSASLVLPSIDQIDVFLMQLLPVANNNQYSLICSPGRGNSSPLARNNIHYNIHC